MTLDSILEILNRQLVRLENHPLSGTEIAILRGIWQEQTYKEIAQQENYRSDYLTTVVAPELFGRLCRLTEQRVTKKNCRVLLETYASAQAEVKNQYPRTEPTMTDPSPDYPEGSIPLKSPYYIPRTAIEAQVYQELNKAGALIRIKAPREMGKTSLLLRLLDCASRQGYRTAYLNLEQTDRVILNDLNRFLRWLSANTTIQLQLEPKLNDYWDEDIGSKISCTLYFQGYLLKSIDTPLVLVIDEVNQIFEHPEVAKDVLPLLRSWHEEGKRLPLWQKLRLVVAHSTEIYVPLQLNQSPFNVGLPVQLEGFDLTEVQQLARQYGLDWAGGEAAQQLNDFVGGHPSLIHLALYHLSRQDITLPELLEMAPAASEIYGYHLQRHQAALQEEPELASALDRVMNATEPVPLEPLLAYKLSSMGLIERVGERAIPGCELYRHYFGTKQREQTERKRRRGVVLTEQGLEKLQQAKADAEFREKKGSRFTLEELSERTGLSVDTLMKVLGGEVAVDRQTLKCCFRAFNLSLESEDYGFPPE